MKHKYPFYATKVHKKNETGNKKNPAVSCGIFIMFVGLPYYDSPAIYYFFTTLTVMKLLVSAMRTM